MISFAVLLIILRNKKLRKKTKKINKITTQEAKLPNMIPWKELHLYKCLLTTSMITAIDQGNYAEC